MWVGCLAFACSNHSNLNKFNSSTNKAYTKYHAPIYKCRPWLVLARVGTYESKEPGRAWSVPIASLVNVGTL